MLKSLVQRIGEYGDTLKNDKRIKYMEIKDLHVAIYGRAKIVRGFCLECQRFTFLCRFDTHKKNYETRCCETKLVIDIKTLPVKRMLEER